MPGTDDRKMASAFKTTKVDDNRIARRAVNADMRSCTG